MAFLKCYTDDHFKFYSFIMVDQTSSPPDAANNFFHSEDGDTANELLRTEHDTITLPPEPLGADSQIFSFREHAPRQEKPLDRKNELQPKKEIPLELKLSLEDILNLGAQRFQSRNELITSLLALNPTNFPGAEVLMEQLIREELQEQSVAETLAGIGEEAADVLIEFIKNGEKPDEKPLEQKSEATLLSPSARETSEPTKLTDKQAMHQYRLTKAAQALGMIGGKKAVNFFIENFKLKIEAAKLSAAKRQNPLEPMSSQKISDLEAAILIGLQYCNNNSQARLYSEKGLDHYSHNERAFQHLINIIEYDDRAEAVGLAAVRAYLGYSDRHEIQVLIQHMITKSIPPRQVAVIKQLWRITYDSLIEELLVNALADSSPLVRQGAARSLKILQKIYGLEEGTNENNETRMYPLLAEFRTWFRNQNKPYKDEIEKVLDELFQQMEGVL